MKNVVPGPCGSVTGRSLGRGGAGTGGTGVEGTGVEGTADGAPADGGATGSGSAARWAGSAGPGATGGMGRVLSSPSGGVVRLSSVLIRGLLAGRGRPLRYPWPQA